MPEPESPLAQGRELKLPILNYRIIKRESPLAQGRELKFCYK